jgi:hypothetical protein
MSRPCRRAAGPAQRPTASPADHAVNSNASPGTADNQGPIRTPFDRNAVAIRRPITAGTSGADADRASRSVAVILAPRAAPYVRACRNL